MRLIDADSLVIKLQEKAESINRGRYEEETCADGIYIAKYIVDLMQTIDPESIMKQGRSTNGGKI